MNYKAFVKDIKDEAKSVYLFYGNEKYLIDWALHMIKEKYVDKALEDMNFTSIDLKQVNSSQIIATAETLPMMSEKRVIFIDGSQVLQGTKVKSFTEEDEKALADYIDKIPKECILVFIGEEKIDKRRSLYKKINKEGLVYEFSQLSVSDLRKWIEKQFRQTKKIITSDRIMLIIEVCGYFNRESDYTLYNLDNDIKKILSYTGTDKEITEEAIMETMSSNMERNVFDLVDYIVENNKEKALKLLSNFLLYGEAQQKLIALLYRQYDNLLLIKVMRENGKDMESIKNIVKLPDFVIRKYIKNSGKMTTEGLKKSLIDLYRIDKEIKSGLISPELALELFIATA
ncbi:MAG: DNA polymerase III subunit delta [Peptostreptococcales bacterium]